MLFFVAHSIYAGIAEETVVLAFLVVTLQQAGRRTSEIAVVALALRVSYHICYGRAAVGIPLWAAVFL